MKQLRSRMKEMKIKTICLIVEGLSTWYLGFILWAIFLGFFDMLLNFTGLYFLQFTIFCYQTSQFYSIWDALSYCANKVSKFQSFSNGKLVNSNSMSTWFFFPCTAFQVCHLKLKQGSVTIKAAVTKYRIEILRNAGVSEKVS